MTENLRPATERREQRPRRFRSTRLWPGRAASSSNRAARRAWSRWAADLVQQQDRRLAPLGALHPRAWASTSRTSTAFCSPVEHCAAGRSRSAWRNSKVAPVRSDRRARPTPHRVASPSASARANRTRTCSAPSVTSQSSTAPSTVTARRGKRTHPLATGSASSRMAQPRRAAAIAMPSRAMRSSSAASQASSRRLFGQQPRPFPQGCARKPRSAAAWAGSRPITSRSRKRRRPPAPSPNSRSIAGVSHTTPTISASAACDLAGSPSMRTTRRSEPASRPVPISSGPAPRSSRAATDQAPARHSPARAAPPRRAGRGAVRGRARGTTSASRMLVLPAPLGPVSTTGRDPRRAAGRSRSGTLRASAVRPRPHRAPHRASRHPVRRRAHRHTRIGIST